MDMIQLKQSPQLSSFLAQKIKTPRYKPTVTAKVAEQLYKHAELYEGQKLTPEDTKGLSQVLAKALGKCKASAFIPILQYFTGSKLSNVSLKFLCQQIAAARHTLKQGVPFDIFRGALGFEWAPFKVYDVLEDSGTHVQHILGVFTDGRPCGLTFDLIQPSVGYRFYKEGGVPRKLLKGIPLSPKDIVGFTYTALLQYASFFPLNASNEAVRRLNPQEAIAAFRCTGTQAQHNKQLYKDRLEPCILDNSKIPSCARCFIGYDTCPRGCQSKTNWATFSSPPTEISIYGRKQIQH